MSKTRIITLTDRPPVRIREEDWPVIAEASYHDYDGEYEAQSFRHWRSWLIVRRHKDGRALVYAVCQHETAYRNERGYEQRAGELLPAGHSTEDLVAAIKRVHGRINIVDDKHRDDWRLLADECIASLPPEEL
jgi:hypothetical protein